MHYICKYGAKVLVLFEIVAQNEYLCANKDKNTAL